MRCSFLNVRSFNFILNDATLKCLSFLPCNCDAVEKKLLLEMLAKKKKVQIKSSTHFFQIIWMQQHNMTHHYKYYNFKKCSCRLNQITLCLAVQNWNNDIEIAIDVCNAQKKSINVGKISSSFKNTLTN